MITSDLSPLDATDPYDVCIIGSGFTGTIVAKALVERGARVLVLESGNRLIHWMLGGQIKQLADYEVTGTAQYLTKHTKARALGGNSNFWTGRCERYHPSDFGRHPYTPADCPWPVTYEDMEPYYERAEETLRVRGGRPSDHAPARRKPFPHPARTDISSLQARLADADVTVDESPTATPERAFRFFRVQREILPKFSGATNCIVVRGATVTRLIGDHDHAIVGAEVKTLDGTTKTARAKLFLVGCGGFETPRLLLLSRSERFPEGIGNRYDRVGRGFNEHPGVNFYGKIHHDRHTWQPAHRIGRTHQFYDDFRADGLGSVLPVFIQSWVFPNHLMVPKLADIPKDFGAFVSRTLRPTLYIGATIEMEPADGNRITLASEKRDPFGNPVAHLHMDFSERDLRTLDRTRALIRDIYARLGATDITEDELTWSRHHIGTCRMGENPRSSVTDPDLKVHECPNLYLCGSESFVTGAAVPPVLTLVALAHRLSDHLNDRLRSG